MGDVITRTLKNGRTAYYARTTLPDGRRVSAATKQQTEEKATEWLHAWEAKMRNGHVGLVKPTKEERIKAREVAKLQQMTFRRLCDRFLGAVENVQGYTPPKAKDVERYRRESRSTLSTRVWPYIADRPAAKITPRELEELRDRLLETEYEEGETYSPGSVVHALAIISKVYQWAVDGGLLAINPAVGVMRPDLPDPKEDLEYLSGHEVATLRAHVHAHAADIYPMLMTALFTGARKGELFGLRWRDVRMDASKIDVMRSYIGKTKGRKSRHIPIHPTLLPVLREWKARCPKTVDGLVFPLHGHMGAREDDLGLGAIYEAAALRRPRAPWHCLRHTYASTAVMAGVDIFTVSRLLGHASVELTAKIYAHLSPDHLQDQVAKIVYPDPKPANVASMEEARRARDLGTQGETGESERDIAAG